MQTEQHLTARQALRDPRFAAGTHVVEFSVSTGVWQFHIRRGVVLDRLWSRTGGRWTPLDAPDLANTELDEAPARLVPVGEADRQPTTRGSLSGGPS